MVALEKEISRFTLRYLLEGMETEVSVHQVDMGGWLLYDCFLLPSYSVIQLEMENGRIQVLDMEDPELAPHAEVLLQMIARKNVFN